MQITTFVRKRDFLVFRLSSLLFPGFVFWFNVLCATLIAWVIYRADQPTILVALACVFYFTLAWLFLVAASMVVAMCEVTFISSLRRGVLGEHRFTLEEDGLLEDTDFNRTLYAWSSVDTSRKIFGALILRAGAGWHVFPRTAFGSSLSRESLLEAIKSMKGLRSAS